MPAPGIYTIDSVTAGVESLEVAFTPNAPLSATKTYLSYKKPADSTWVTLDLAGASSPATIWGLESAEDYEVTVVGIDETESPDEFGPGSFVSEQTTLTSSFGAKLVDWGPDGVNSSPTTVDNTGTKGSTYNLDTLIDGSGALSNQVRNGRNVWQISGGPEGLSLSPTPPVSGISQPCTVYIALDPFVRDGNFRWVMRGGFDDLQIKQNNAGWTFTTASGSGTYNVGATATNRLYVLECVVDDDTSIFRVEDSTGNDTGDIATDVDGTADIRPESMGWDVPKTANQACEGQYYRAFIVDGIPTTAERTALRAALFGMFDSSEPNIISYTPTPSVPSMTLGAVHLSINIGINI